MHDLILRRHTRLHGVRMRLCWSTHQLTRGLWGDLFCRTRERGVCGFSAFFSPGPLRCDLCFLLHAFRKERLRGFLLPRPLCWDDLFLLTPQYIQFEPPVSPLDSMHDYLPSTPPTFQRDGRIAKVLNSHGIHWSGRVGEVLRNTRGVYLGHGYLPRS